MVIHNDKLSTAFYDHETWMRIIIIMMHNDAQWIKMQEGGLLNVSGLGEGFKKWFARNRSAMLELKIVTFWVQVYDPQHRLA